jgi:hypothetical protein
MLRLLRELLLFALVVIITRSRIHTSKSSSVKVPIAGGISVVRHPEWRSVITTTMGLLLAIYGLSQLKISPRKYLRFVVGDLVVKQIVNMLPFTYFKPFFS